MTNVMIRLANHADASELNSGADTTMIVLANHGGASEPDSGTRQHHDGTG